MFCQLYNQSSPDGILEVSTICGSILFTEKKADHPFLVLWGPVTLSCSGNILSRQKGGHRWAVCLHYWWESSSSSPMAMIDDCWLLITNAHIWHCLAAVKHMCRISELFVAKHPLMEVYSWASEMIRIQPMILNLATENDYCKAIQESGMIKFQS